MTSKGSASKADIKVAINVISLALAYILLHVPFTIVVVMFTYFPSIFLTNGFEKGLDIFSVYSSIGMGLNSIVDAFVFVFVSKRFRAVLYQMLRCKCGNK